VFLGNKCRTGLASILMDSFLDCDLPRVTEFKVATFMDYEIVKDTLTRDPYQSSRNIHQTLLNDGARLSISTTKRLIKALIRFHAQRSQICPDGKGEE